MVAASLVINPNFNCITLNLNNCTSTHIVLKKEVIKYVHEPKRTYPSF